MLKIFYSNRVEQLYHLLSQNLFSDFSPFARRLIIVPTVAIKSWLLLQLAKDRGIATGLEVLYLDDAIQHLNEEFIQTKIPPTYHPAPLELSLKIEEHISKIAHAWAELTAQQKNLWKPLFDYLKINFNENGSTRFSKRSEKRLASLATSMAELFKDYGKYGQHMVQAWDSSIDDWQQALWSAVFSTENHWEILSPSDPIVESTTVHARPLKIYLFSVSFLSSSDFYFYEKMSQHLPVHYYSLSPCYYFWSDTVSDKEAKRLELYWKKRGVSKAQQKTLEDYLKDRNPLLANWGKLGRQMTVLLEESNHESFTHYSIPSCLQSMEVYRLLIDDFLPLEASHPLPSLLQCIQADMLLMRNPQTEKIFLPSDKSIQLHGAPTKPREVEVLYHNLLNIINNEKHLEPCDIIVMAPDINVYAPYIRQIFGAEQSLLDFQLMDIHTLSEESLTKQFWHLIKLPFSRWNAEEILFLLSFSSFQQRHQFSPEDIQSIRHWIEDAKILWGGDAAHRNELLHQRYCQHMIENTNQGTWEGGFETLLLGLTMQTPADFQTVGVEMSQGVLLGKFISVLRSLKHDLAPLTDNSPKTYAEWVLILKSLIYNYLIDEPQSEEGEREALLDFLDTLSQSSRWIPEHQVTFNAVKSHLESHLNQQSVVYRENHLQTVKFCSMLPMRAIPSKVIALLGLQENAFPRLDHSSSLNLMKEHPECDYYPSRTDYDRYLFLETLLSAREYLLLSYTTHSFSDGKTQEPSLLITELMHYIDQAFITSHPDICASLTYKHPYTSYHSDYFTPHAVLKNFSHQDYQAALSYYQSVKNSPHLFLHEFKFQKNEPFMTAEIYVSLQQIKNTIQNPIKNYFNKTLGMYIGDEESFLQTEESFVVDALQMYHLKKDSLKQGLQPLVEQAEKQGKLPLGLFKQTAIQSIQQEVMKYHKTLSEMQVDIKKVGTIYLNDHFQNSFQENEEWKFPCFEFNYKNTELKIEGTISDVCEQGLIAQIRGDKKDIIKPWAEFVILCCLIDKYQLPIKKQILCIKSGKIKHAYFEDPKIIFEQILDYYFECTQQVSPLTHEWLHDILYQDAETLQKVMKKSLADTFNPLYNDYLQWVCRLDSLNSEDVISTWQPKANALFSNLYQAWVVKDE